MLKPLAGLHLNQDHSAGCAWGMINMAAPAEYGRLMQRGQTISLILPCGCKGMVIGSGMQLVHRPEGWENFTYAVVHLFNHHVMTVKDWTMDRLIDWLRSVEPSDPEEDANATFETAQSEETPERDGAVPVLR